MPTQTHRFPTSEPIALDVRNPRGAVEVLAAEVDETIVEVTTSHEEELVETAMSPDGRSLRVEVPRRRRWGKQPRVNISVHVPRGSSATVDTVSASITVRGPLAGLHLSSVSGSVHAEEAHGPVGVGTTSGSIHLGAVHGTLEARAVSGSIRIGEVDDAAVVRTVSGSIDVGSAAADLRARAVSGSIHVNEASSGTVDLSSTSGGVIVGVRRGTLVWLDLSSVSGRTRSDLAGESVAPGDSEGPLILTARSISGGITVRPSVATPVAH